MTLASCLISAKIYFVRYSVVEYEICVNIYINNWRDRCCVANELEDSYTGQRFVVRHCLRARESFVKALEGVPSKQKKKFIHWMEMQIKRLADGKPMSTENFPQEGPLPNKPGKKRRCFKALKKLPIRGYCWKSERHPNVWYISHYIHKKKDPLSEQDIKKVGNNWTRIEDKGDEY